MQRYIWLTELIPELLDMVDEKKMAFGVAVELSYLRKDEQTELLSRIVECGGVPSLAQARRLKGCSQEGEFSVEVMEGVMSSGKKVVGRVVFDGGRLEKYFPDAYTPKQMEEVIIKLLEDWREQRNA